MAGTPLTAETINRNRARVTWIVRGLAAAMVALGAYLVLKRIGFLAGTADLQVVFQVYTDDFGESNSMYRGLALLVVGGSLAGLSRRLAGWIITVPSAACPGCGYPRPSGDGARTCPECGLELR